MKVLEPILADVLPGAIADHEQFGGRHTPTGRSRDQHLCEDSAERHRQILTNGRLPLG
jgi:hypothetical protein